MHGIYGALATVLVFVPRITKPYDAAMGLLITLVTGIPYYLLFVKKIVPMKAAEKYNREFKYLTTNPMFVDESVRIAPYSTDYILNDCQWKPSSTPLINILLILNLCVNILNSFVLLVFMHITKQHQH